MREYSRTCPKCGKTLEYKSYSAWYTANKQQSLCRNCASVRKALRVADLSVLLEDNYCSYYWMGFLLADGSFSNNRLKFTLKKSDAEQVHKFGKFISYTGTYGISEISESVSCKDSVLVPEIMNKFNIFPNKTYNPPVLENIDSDYLYCILAGFIDGDGNIQNQSARQDFMLRIKLHQSWLGVLNLFSSIICGEEKAIINNQGYAQLTITDTKILQNFKRKILSYNLPLLTRKWDIINMDFVSKYTTAKDLRNKVIDLLRQNVKQKDIALICNTSPANVTRIKKLYEK